MHYVSSAAHDYGTDWGFYLSRVHAHEVLAVKNQFVDRLVDVGKRRVFLLFLEATAQVRPPAFDQFLERTDVKIAVMEKSLQPGHVVHQKTPVLADGVAAQG